MINKSKYENIEIPKNLGTVVKDAVDEGLLSGHISKRSSIIKAASATAAALVVCVITVLNVSPVFAKAAYDIPVLGDMCRIFTFQEYHFEDEIKYVDTRIPQIDNTGKTDLEKRVNLEIQKIISDRLAESETRAQEYYNAFVETGGDPKDYIPIEITVDYDVKHVSEKYTSFVVSQFESFYSAYNYNYYYNIDMESGRIFTLKDWFGNDYRRIVAKSIEHTIADWNEEQKSLLWDDLSVIDLISENTNFYLNEEGQIVVVFEKYEAAAGAAGTLEFTISDSGL